MRPDVNLNQDKNYVISLKALTEDLYVSCNSGLPEFHPLPGRGDGEVFDAITLQVAGDLNSAMTVGVSLHYRYEFCVAI